MGLCPWFGLCPFIWAKGRTRGPAPLSFFEAFRRGGAPPHIRRRSRCIRSAWTERAISGSPPHIRRRSLNERKADTRAWTELAEPPCSNLSSHHPSSINTRRLSTQHAPYPKIFWPLKNKQLIKRRHFHNRERTRAETETSCTLFDLFRC